MVLMPVIAGKTLSQDGLDEASPLSPTQTDTLKDKLLDDWKAAWPTKSQALE